MRLADGIECGGMGMGVYVRMCVDVVAVAEVRNKSCQALAWGTAAAGKWLLSMCAG